MRPDWLPPELQLNGMSLQDDLEELFSVYKRDFIDTSPPIVEGMKVYSNDYIDRGWNDPRFTHGFTHIITRGEGYRLIDYARARKLPWIRAVIDNHKMPEVSVFWVAHHVDGMRLILWLEDFDFVVILSRKRRPNKAEDRGAIIITAYDVDPRHRRRFSKLRENKLA